MSSATLLRPGSAIGAYPQREDVRDSWLDRFVDGANGLIRQHLIGRNPRYKGYVDLINRHAQGLDKLDEFALKSHINVFRKQLYSEGLKDELVAESFAIVREVTSRQLGMRHHDVQLYGGWVMLQGMVAEMETGEGKTLVATLPVYLNALTGKGVHVITVNDYLATRDAEWMGRLYGFLGMTTGAVVHGISNEERQASYASYITY